MALSSWPEILAGLIARQDLTPASARWAMARVLSGEATPAQIAGFAVALRAKGETAAEVTALVAEMLEHAVTLELSGLLVDTCGTGGDGSGTVNISTMAALVVAAAGEQVVKHGNRGVSSPTGSADVLEALGVPVDLAPEQVARCVTEAGIGFCFAPVFHPAMRHAGPARRELGVPTVFNILGPLANPARVQAQVVGVADARLAPVVAGVLAARGTSALVVRGQDGLDEVSTSGPTQVWEVHEGAIVGEHVVTPGELGVSSCEHELLLGGDAERNAQIARDVLAGRSGAVAEAVIINAAAALVAADAHRGAQGPLLVRWAACVGRAREALGSGAAQEVLARWVQVARA